MDNNNNNNSFIYIAPLKTMFTKCSAESQGKTNGIVRNKYIIKKKYIYIYNNNNNNSRNINNNNYTFYL